MSEYENFKNAFRNDRCQHVETNVLRVINARRKADRFKAYNASVCFTF